MIEISKIFPDPKKVEWQDTMTILVSGYDILKTIKVTLKDVTPGREPYYHDGHIIHSKEQRYDSSFNEVNSGGTLYLKLTVREVPFVIGKFEITVTQDGVSSEPYPELYEPDQRENDGVRFSTTITINNNKNVIPLVGINQIKGVPHVYRSMYDFFYMPREHMVPGMSTSVIFPDGIRVYGLMIEGDPMNMPWPLRDLPRGKAGSYRNYWELLSVSKPESSVTSEKQFAPDFKGGPPPYYDGYIEGVLDMEGYVFPPGPQYDEERSWTDDPSNWTNEDKDGDRWYRYREPEVIYQDEDGVARKVRKWSRPIRKGQLPDTIIQNRFIRTFTKTDTPAITYNGRPNVFGIVEHFGVEYAYTDEQPARRTWDDLRQEEKDAYENEFGAVTDPEDSTLLSRINRLWMISVEKDMFNNLRGSAWEGPIEIPDGDGSKVRYSISNDTDINQIRADGGDSNPQLYEDGGWNEMYREGDHRFMAYRLNVGDQWMVIQTSGEIGNYHKDVFKQYPINYFDRIHNVNTAKSFIPVGKDASNNPEDPIEDPWLDTPPVGTLKPGYEIYRSKAVLTADGKDINNWSNLTLWSNREPVIDTLVPSADAFITKVEGDMNGSGGEDVTRTPDYIDLTASLHQGGVVLNDKTVEAGHDPSAVDIEQIRYKWFLLYNGGNAYGPMDSEDNLILDDGRRPLGKLLWDSTDPDNTDELEEMDASIHEDGRVLRISAGTVNSQATFKCIQERNVEGNMDFDGTGLSWIPYISTVSISDLVDKTLRGISIVQDTGQFVIKDTSLNELSKADFVGPTAINITAHVQNVDVGTGRWYRWKNELVDYNTLRDSTLEGTDGAQAWKTIVESTDPDYWEDLDDTDLEHRVLWNSHGFNLKSSPNYHVFKYRTDTEGKVIQDLTVISRISEGRDARDIKIFPENFVISLNEDNDAFEAGKSTSQVFEVTAQGISSPTFTWELVDGSGNVIDTNTGNTYTFEADHTKPGSQFDTFQEMKDSFPLYVRVMCDQFPSLKEDAVIQVLRGGSFGIKGDPGSGGISVIFDKTDLLPTDSSGTPIGTVNESMEVMVFEGKVKQEGGTDLGQYQITVNDVTPGTEYTIENGLTILTTDVDPLVNQVVFKFSVKRNTSASSGTDSEMGYIIDGEGVRAEFTYTIKKSRAGANSTTLSLEDPTGVVTREGNTIISKTRNITIAGVSYPVIHESYIRLYDGATEVPLISNRDIEVMFGNVIISRVATEGDYGIFEAGVSQTVTYTQRSFKILLSRVDGRVLIVLARQGANNFPSTEHVGFRLNISGKPNHIQRVSLTPVVQPEGGIQLQVLPSNTAVMPWEKGNNSFKTMTLKAYRGGLEYAQYISANLNDIKWYVGGTTISHQITGASPKSYVTQNKAIANIHPDDVNGSTTVYANIRGLWANVTLYDVSDSRPRWVLYAGFKNPPSGNSIVKPPNVIGNHGSIYIDYSNNQANGYRTSQGRDSVAFIYSIDAGLVEFRRNGIAYRGTQQFDGPVYWITDDLSKISSSWAENDYFLCEGKEIEKGRVQWGPWSRMRGEKGEPGKSMVYVTLYKKDSSPSKNGDTSLIGPITDSIQQKLDSGWSFSVPVTGVNEYVYEIKRPYEYPDATKSSVNPDSYVEVTGSVWTGPTRLTGIRGDSGDTPVNVYRLSSVNGNPPAITPMVVNPSGWSYTPMSATKGNAVWVAYGLIRDDAMVSPGWKVLPTPIARHIDDVKGSIGPSGPPPEHSWNGTSLRFKNPDGSWGSYVNLSGSAESPSFISSGTPVHSSWVSVGNSSNVRTISINNSVPRTRLFRIEASILLRANSTATHEDYIIRLYKNNLSGDVLAEKRCFIPYPEYREVNLSLITNVSGYNGFSVLLRLERQFGSDASRTEGYLTAYAI